MVDEPGTVERRIVNVVVDGRPLQWPLNYSADHDDGANVELVGEGDSWVGTGWNLFEALKELRRQTDPLGIKVCCQGARTQAAISGMAASMGLGRSVYIVTVGRRSGQGDLVPIFDPAEPDDIGTVGEQEAYYRRFLDEPRPLWRPRNLVAFISDRLARRD